MQGRQIMITGPRQVAAQPIKLTKESLGPSEIIVQTRVSLLSGGTEGAWFQGQHVGDRAPVPYPRSTGYAVVGRVLAAGDEAAFQPGDSIYAMQPHASHLRIDTAQQMVLPVPDELAPEIAVFARLVAVPLASVRTANARLGDRAAVVGLGLVGNLGAQVCRAAGLLTTGVDPVATRRALAERCGIDQTLDPTTAEVLQPLHRLVLEASGTAKGALTAVKLARMGGEVSLVGTPWVPDPTVSVSPLLEAIHLRYVTIRSGWEWQFPRKDGTDQAGAVHQPGSVPHNHQVAFGLLRSGQIKVRELITHRYQPEECQLAYSAAVDRKSEQLGVIFCWE